MTPRSQRFARERGQGVVFYRILADITVIVHVAYVLFVVLGVVAILLGWLRKWQWVRIRGSGTCIWR